MAIHLKIFYNKLNIVIFIHYFNIISIFISLIVKKIVVLSIFWINFYSLILTFRFFSFALITLFVTELSGQEHSYLFVRTNPDIGNRAITCMTTDSNNHMWIGTYGGGLKRYDGLNVETYNHDPFSKSSISSSTVFDLIFNKYQKIAENRMKAKFKCNANL